jgi:cytochrome P450
VLGFLVRQYQRMGPIFRIRVPGETYTVIAGQQANLFMSREGNNHFRSKEFWQHMDRELGAKTTLISSDGEIHSRLRQLEKRGYSRSTIEARLPDVVEIARRAAAEFPADRSLPVYPWLQEVITEQLGTIIAGTAPGDYVQDVVHFVRTALLVHVTRQRPGFLTSLPGYKRAKQRTFELGNRILDWHRAHPPLDRPTNLIDDALAAAQDGSLVAPEDLMPFALGPYIAGLDTAASTTAFLLYALFADPQLRQRVQAEADELFAGEGVTPAKVRALDVLQRVFLETLRRYPIAPAVQRTVTQPFEFAGHRVDAGGRIFIGTTVPHFIPELHPDPYRFDIDRYLPPRNEHRLVGAFAPFSLGAHTCLGAGLAEIQIMLTVAALLHYGRFEFTTPNYELKTRTAPTPAPDNSFKIKLTGKE